MRTAISAFCLPALLLSACLQGSELDATSPSVSQSEVQSLPHPESGAPASEYTARAVTLRLFGIQGTKNPGAAFATLADTATWTTRNYRLGETVGRNLKLTAITPAGIELGAADGTVRIPVGGQAKVRVIEHQFDLAAVEQGRHTWSLQPGSLARIKQRYGLGVQTAPVTLNNRDALKLTAVAPASVFDRLGFQAGDLIYDVAGQKATTDQLSRLGDLVTRPGGGTVKLTMSRGHSMWETTYVLR